MYFARSLRVASYFSKHVATIQKPRGKVVLTILRRRRNLATFSLPPLNFHQDTLPGLFFTRSLRLYLPTFCSRSNEYLDLLRRAYAAAAGGIETGVGRTAVNVTRHASVNIPSSRNRMPLQLEPVSELVYSHAWSTKEHLRPLVRMQTPKPATTHLIAGLDEFRVKTPTVHFAYVNIISCILVT